MITKLQERERTKADRYWPLNTGSELYYDGILVKFVKETTPPGGGGMTVRTFYIGEPQVLLPTGGSCDVSQEDNDDYPSTPITTPPRSCEEVSTFSSGSGSSPTDQDGELPSEEDDSDPELSDRERKELSARLEEECERNPLLRKVVQLHCTEWPDQGVPPSTDSMISLMYELDMRSDPTNKTSPICVHCSAGIGRTGTFVAIRMCIADWLVGEPVNIYDTVKHLRDQRQGSVQTKDQYRFIYAAVQDIIFDKEHKKKSRKSKTVSATLSNPHNSSLSDNIRSVRSNPKLALTVSMPSTPVSIQTSAPINNLELARHTLKLDFEGSPSKRRKNERHVLSHATTS